MEVETPQQIYLEAWNRLQSSVEELDKKIGQFNCFANELIDDIESRNDVEIKSLLEKIFLIYLGIQDQIKLLVMGRICREFQRVNEGKFLQDRGDISHLYKNVLAFTMASEEGLMFAKKKILKLCGTDDKLKIKTMELKIPQITAKLNEFDQQRYVIILSISKRLKNFQVRVGPKHDEAYLSYKLNNVEIKLERSSFKNISFENPLGHSIPDLERFRKRSLRIVNDNDDDNNRRKVHHSSANLLQSQSDDVSLNQIKIGFGIDPHQLSSRFDAFQQEANLSIESTGTDKSTISNSIIYTNVENIYKQSQFQLQPLVNDMSINSQLSSVSTNTTSTNNSQYTSLPIIPTLESSKHILTIRVFLSDDDLLVGINKASMKSVVVHSSHSTFGNKTFMDIPLDISDRLPHGTTILPTVTTTNDNNDLNKVSTILLRLTSEIWNRYNSNQSTVGHAVASMPALVCPRSLFINGEEMCPSQLVPLPLHTGKMSAKLPPLVSATCYSGEMLPYSLLRFQEKLVTMGLDPKNVPPEIIQQYCRFVSTGFPLGNHHLSPYHIIIVDKMKTENVQKDSFPFILSFVGLDLRNVDLAGKYLYCALEVLQSITKHRIVLNICNCQLNSATLLYLLLGEVKEKEEEVDNIHPSKEGGRTHIPSLLSLRLQSISSMNANVLREIVMQIRFREIQQQNTTTTTTTINSEQMVEEILHATTTVGGHRIEELVLSQNIHLFHSLPVDTDEAHVSDSEMYLSHDWEMLILYFLRSPNMRRFEVSQCIPMNNSSSSSSSSSVTTKQQRQRILLHQGVRNALHTRRSMGGMTADLEYLNIEGLTDFSDVE